MADRAGKVDKVADAPDKPADAVDRAVPRAAPAADSRIFSSIKMVTRPPAMHLPLCSPALTRAARLPAMHSQ